MYFDQSYHNCPNPEFIEMAQLIEDPYWQEKMLLAAKGKFPKKVSYRNGEIRFRKNSSMAVEKLPSDPYNAAMLVIEFIRKFTGLASASDKHENRRQLNAVSEKHTAIRDCTWKDIKGKGAKFDILNRYSREIAQAMKLTELQRCQLIKTIQCGLFCGRLTNDHMIMDQGRITQVTGLCFDDTTNTFKLDPNTAPYKPSKPLDPKLAINPTDSYIKRHRKTPMIGNVITGLVDYFANQVADIPVMAPLFVIVDSPTVDTEYILDNYIDEPSPTKDVLYTIDMIDSLPDTFTDSPESYENSTSVSSAEGFR